MIIIEKVDLHTPKLDRLNKAIDAGFKPIAWVPYSNRMVVFLEGSSAIEVASAPIEAFVPTPEDMGAPPEGSNDNISTPINDTICIGTTVAGNPCKGARFEGTEYCVAHQDQG